MPAVPELGNRDRTVRHLKILHETEAHHTRASDRHVRIPGEIAIDLNGVTQSPLQQRESIVIPWCFENEVDVRGDLIRDHEFFNRAQCKLSEPNFKIEGGGANSSRKLREQINRAINWTGQELREKGYKQQEIARAMAGTQPPPIGLDRICHALKRKERNASGRIYCNEAAP